MDEKIQLYALIKGNFLPVSIYFVDETDGTASVASVNGKPTSRVSRFHNSSTFSPWIPVSDIYTLNNGLREAVTINQLRKRCFVHTSIIAEAALESTNA